MMGSTPISVKSETPYCATFLMRKLGKKSLRERLREFKVRLCGIDLINVFFIITSIFGLCCCFFTLYKFFINTQYGGFGSEKTGPRTVSAMVIYKAKWSWKENSLWVNWRLLKKPSGYSSFESQLVWSHLQSKIQNGYDSIYLIKVLVFFQKVLILLHEIPILLQKTPILFHRILILLYKIPLLLHKIPILLHETSILLH